MRVLPEGRIGNLSVVCFSGFASNLFLSRFILVPGDFKRIVRKCSTKLEVKKTGCFYRAASGDIQAIHCACRGDKCNSAKPLKALTLLAIFIPLNSIFISVGVYRFWRTPLLSLPFRGGQNLFGTKLYRSVQLKRVDMFGYLK